MIRANSKGFCASQQECGQLTGPNSCVNTSVAQALGLVYVFGAPGEPSASRTSMEGNEVSLTRIATKFYWSILLLLGFTGAAHAQMGQSENWQMDFQEAATPVMERITSFHEFILWIIVIITLFVLALLIWIILRYNAKANPTPKTFSHNTLLEIIWTGGPIIILVVIGYYSLPLLWYEELTPEADITIKATGHQWYWSYEYPDHGNFGFVSALDEEGEPRLLATTQNVVVPVDTNVRILVTAERVLHSWAMPSFGVKMDAVPGRINETWFHATETGMFYGQCSELCGINHAFMPISVEVVTQEEFDVWVNEQRGAAGLPPMESETRQAADAVTQEVADATTQHVADATGH